MPIYSNMPEDFYPHPSDVNAPLRSPLGVGPRGPQGHSITAEIVDNDPYGYFRVRFKDAETGEVLVVTPNLDVGSRIFVTSERTTMNDTAIGVTHSMPSSDLTPLQASSDRSAVRVGDLIIFNAQFSDETLLSVDTFGVGVVNRVDNQRGDGTFVEYDVVHFVVTNVFTAQISDGAITADKLANKSITTNKLADGAVTTNKLADNSVTSEKIKDGEVKERDLANGSVVTDKIKDNAVTREKIRNGAVTEQKLENGSVTTNKIRDGAVTLRKLSAEAANLSGPTIANPVEWTAGRDYDVLTMVIYEGNSYTSRQFVPAGIDITNQEYWAETGNYNAQIEQYRQETIYKGMGFPTVSDMKECDQLYVGVVCTTLGYHSVGDGGAATYIITDAGTADEMEYISCGSLIAQYAYLGSCSPQQFGAHADGIHNDTDAVMTALKYNQIKFSGIYMTNQLDINVNNVLHLDLNGAKFIPCDVISYLFNIIVSQDNANIIIENGIIDGIRKVCNIIRITGDTNFNTNIKINNMELSNTDNYSNDFNSGCIYISCGNITEINDCYIHDVYRSFDNEGVRGSSGIGISSIINAKIHDNRIENIHKSDTGNKYDCDSLLCYSNNIDAICEVYGNIFKNSQRRFIKFQMENVYVHDNMFLQTVENDLCFPFDFQRGVGRFDHNYIKIDTNTSSEHAIIKMQPIHNSRMSVCDNNFIISDAIGNVLDWIVILESANVETDFDNLFIDINNNYIDHGDSKNTGILDFRLTTPTEIYMNIIGNISTCGYRIIYIYNNVPDTFAYKIHGHIDKNKSSKSLIADTMVVYGNNSILQNLYISYDNSTYSRRNNLTLLDCTKVDRCCYYVGSSSTFTELTNLPIGFSANDFSYKEIECKRQANNINIFKSTNIANDGTITIKYGKVDIQ